MRRRFAPAAVARRHATSLAAALIVAGVVIAAAAGPGTTVWYEAHQRRLAADFAAARATTAPGQALALLQIPKVGVNVAVVEGTSANELRSGPGHVIGSTRPGRAGTAVIEGHLHGWGAPFARLGELQKDDPIVVQTRAAAPIVFKVSAITKGSAPPERPQDAASLVLRAGSGASERIVTAIAGVPTADVGVPASRRGGHGAEPMWGLLGLGLLGAATTVVAHRRGLLGRRLLIAAAAPIGALAAGLLLAADGLLPPLR